jgi:diacylglycerol kinase family enzyme
MGGFLIVNPRSGGARKLDDLLTAAAERRISTHVLRPGQESLVELARVAQADAVGIAGGDGSLGPVASVCLERRLPFVCVPFGTRNHFARDLGLDRSDPVRALDAFAAENERRIDVGRANERLFLNNVSLGIYARLVVVRERHRRRGDVLARLRALAIVALHPEPEGISIDGMRVRARIVVIANNRYKVGGFSLGVRERLDEGLLHLYVPAAGLLHRRWDERAGERFELDSSRRHLHAGLDGEPVTLRRPIEFRIEPQALRVLVPPSRRSS